MTVRQEKCKSQEKEIQSCNRGDKARTSAEESVRGGFVQEQPVDSKIPSGHVFGDIRAHKRGDRGYSLAQ